jgi:ATP-binding cassette subfamily B protein
MSAIAEVFSLGAVVPFIGILTQPEQVLESSVISGFVRSIGITDPQDLIVPLTMTFGIAALISGALRLALLAATVGLSTATGADLSIDVYQRTLYQPYRVHVSRSSSEIIAGITQKVGIANRVLMSLANLVTSGILFISILSTLVVIDPRIAGTAIAIFGGGYSAIAMLTKYRLRKNSVLIAAEQTRVVKILQEGLGAIRDVLIDGTQKLYTRVYGNAVRKLLRANAENSFINEAPRYLMESLGLVLVAFGAWFLSFQPGSIAAALPVLGAIALGAQRLLPLLQQFYGNWALVSGSQGGLVDVLALLEQPLPDEVESTPVTPIDFKELLEFSDVRFRYTDSGPWVLDGLTLNIPRGSRIGFVGSTGSGKSTAMDLIMALLDPTDGAILVDRRPITGHLRRAWQRTLAHVPQTIYLADASIAENIAFGMPVSAIDHNRVREAAEQAQIANFIEGRPGGYASVVGERGVRLSGGQRQRIGIARALYKQASILIFDEATSALDSTTEAAVLSAIENLDRELTILIIAHRLTTLQGCDKIVLLGSGQIVAEGTYDEFCDEYPASDHVFKT